MQCLKELSQKQNISIITSIHQPNSDILQMFDSLYVLAKGGQCIYSGPPEHLTQHLFDSNIILNENQVPIETLITIGAKGMTDKKVIYLRNKTNEKLHQMINEKINETKEKLIKQNKKSFLLKDVYILLQRTITEFYCYKWKHYLISSLMLIMTALMLSLTFNTKIGEHNDCISFSEQNNESCLEQMDNNYMTEQNITFIAFNTWLLFMIQLIIAIYSKLIILNIFSNEHQNS